MQPSADAIQRHGVDSIPLLADSMQPLADSMQPSADAMQRHGVDSIPPLADSMQPSLMPYQAELGFHAISLRLIFKMQ